MKKNLQIFLLVITCFYISSCAKKDSSDKSNNRFESSANASKAFLLESGNYELKLDSSRLDWECGWLGGMSHNGDIKFKNGKIEIKNNNSVFGKFVVDMNKIDCFDLSGGAKSKLISHLKSDDFFGANDFPTATLEFNSSNRYNDDGGQIFNGNLTIKGITNEVEFSAKLVRQTPLLHAVGKLVFDRSKYNVRFRSGSFFDDLGDKLILDDIEVDINLIAEPA